MATVKVKRTDLIAKMREVLDGKEEAKPVITSAHVGKAIRYVEDSVAWSERTIREAQARLKEQKADLKALKRAKPSDTVVMKYVRVDDGQRRYGPYALSVLERELRLLEMSDEEYVRVGTTSNWVQFI